MIGNPGFDSFSVRMIDALRCLAIEHNNEMSHLVRENQRLRQECALVNGLIEDFLRREAYLDDMLASLSGSPAPIATSMAWHGWVRNGECSPKEPITVRW